MRVNTGTEYDKSISFIYHFVQSTQRVINGYRSAKRVNSVQVIKLSIYFFEKKSSKNDVIIFLAVFFNLQAVTRLVQPVDSIGSSYDELSVERIILETSACPTLGLSQ